MFHLLKSFLSSDEGAVTVDWVVLTAAVVLMGVGVGVLVLGAVEDGSEQISDDVVANTS